MRVVQKALTFDDVLLIPAHSAVLPREVSLKTKLTRGITLNIPLLAAAMLTEPMVDVQWCGARQTARGSATWQPCLWKVSSCKRWADRSSRREGGMAGRFGKCSSD